LYPLGDKFLSKPFRRLKLRFQGRFIVSQFFKSLTIFLFSGFLFKSISFGEPSDMSDAPSGMEEEALDAPPEDASFEDAPPGESGESPENSKEEIDSPSEAASDHSPDVSDQSSSEDSPSSDSEEKINSEDVSSEDAPPGESPEKSKEEVDSPPEASSDAPDKSSSKDSSPSDSEEKSDSADGPTNESSEKTDSSVTDSLPITKIDLENDSKMMIINEEYKEEIKRIYAAAGGYLEKATELNKEINQIHELLQKSHSEEDAKLDEFQKIVSKNLGKMRNVAQKASSYVGKKRGSNDV
jgi:hypothetical protein